MTRTIPGFLGTVPVNYAVQVSADGRVLVDVAAIIAIGSDLATTTTDNRPFARLDAGDITHVAGREVILVLLGHIQILFEIFWCRAKGNPRRIVELCPLVLSPLHKL